MRRFLIAFDAFTMRLFGYRFRVTLRDGRKFFIHSIVCADSFCDAMGDILDSFDTESMINDFHLLTRTSRRDVIHWDFEIKRL